MKCFISLSSIFCYAFQREQLKGSGSRDVIGEVNRRMEQLDVQSQNKHPRGEVNNSTDLSGYPDEEEWD